MERKFKFAPDEYYHIYNRGVDKRKIFLTNNDHRRFVKLLYLANSEKSVDFKTVKDKGLDEIDRGQTIVDIGAYCLMPNHFHLLLREKKDNGITIFLSKLSTAYSMYFNKRHDRSGRLLEGIFKATHVDNDEYLKYLFAYIHLNPIKLIDPSWKDYGIKDRESALNYLTNYQFSSYLDYLGENRGEKLILNRESFPGYFHSPKDFDDYLGVWLDNDDQKLHHISKLQG